MKLTRIIIALLFTSILLQEKTTPESTTESALQLQKKAFELLLQASQDLAPTDPDKLKFNQPIEAGLAVTWIDDGLGEACSISLDKLDEHTSIVMFSHAKPHHLKDFNLDTESTKKLALIRHVSNFIGMKKAFVNKQEEESGLSVPARP